MILVVGNKNYSSWSFRPWLALSAAGIAFEDKVVPLSDPDFKATVLRYSPAGMVPVLIDGEVHVWESLAIIEYVAERYPDAGLWPARREARAKARAVSAEMHSGFAALRQHCPMNMRRPVKPRDLTAAVQADVARIDAIWSDCLAASGGPFLFGPFSAADAMYAPVVSRFHTYSIDVSPAARSYMATVMALPAWRTWAAAAAAEPWVLPEDEVD